MVNEFQHISLLNGTFKVISKVLANWLHLHIHLLVDQVQQLSLRIDTFLIVMLMHERFLRHHTIPIWR